MITILIYAFTVCFGYNWFLTIIILIHRQWRTTTYLLSDTILGTFHLWLDSRSSIFIYLLTYWEKVTWVLHLLVFVQPLHGWTSSLHHRSSVFPPDPGHSQAGSCFDSQVHRAFSLNLPILTLKTCMGIQITEDRVHSAFCGVFVQLGWWQSVYSRGLSSSYGFCSPACLPLTILHSWIFQ